VAGRWRVAAAHVLTQDVQLYAQGIRELRKALRDADPQLAREFQSEFKSVADIVASDARGRVPSRSGRSARSIRAVSGGNTVYVKGGKKAVPYYGWLDFGSRTPRSGNPRSVGPWRGSGRGPREGRFIYPAIRSRQRQIVAAAEAAFDKAARKVGLK
jgi:hypothetical protein